MTQKECFIVQEKRPRINGEITAREVRLIGVDGDQLGVMTLAAALQVAEELHIDLVEIAPLASPPVCRVVDYGKYKYREAKKTHEAKLKQKIIQIKEMKFRPTTDEADYQVKLKNLIRFLQEGDKAKVTMKFRGREIAHQEHGMATLERIRNDLLEYGQVEQFPKLEGRQLIMILVSKK